MRTESTDGHPPWSFARQWGGIGRIVNLNGPVHWADFGGPAIGPPIVLVHGLGGSHLNWVEIAPALSERTRTIALDLPGFGLSPAGSRQTGVTANAELLDRFLREVLGTPAIVVGNSMGGMISLLEADAHPDAVAAVALIDPSLPPPRRLPDPEVAVQFLLYSIPVVGEGFLALGKRRMSDRQLVERVVQLCFADPGRASEAVLAAATELAGRRRELPSQDAPFLQAARSLLRVLARRQRFERLMAGLDMPVLLVHGERDRLVPVAAARAALAGNPRWDGAIIPGVGHTPQLEAPLAVLEHLAEWLDRHSLDTARPG